MLNVCPETIHEEPVALYSGRAQRNKPARLAALIAAGFVLSTVAGCSAGYYAQLAVQQAKFLRRAVPIEQAIEQSEDPARKELLALVLEARAYAATKGLDPGGSYAKVSSVEGLAVAHVVTAAHRNKLEPYVWRYPIVGAIPYRGYFDLGKAEAVAAELGAEGYDTMLVQAAAYSTLGWFDDPLPSSLLERDRVSLITTVFHELAHQRLFVRSNIAFNETFANVAGLRTAMRFFEDKGESEAADEVARRYRGWLSRGAFFDGVAGDLEQFFATAPPDEGLLSQRTALYATAQREFKQRGFAHPNHPGFEQGEMNNARFLAIYRYSKRSGEFDAFFTSYAGVPEALDALEVRVKETDDPYAALAVQ